MAKKKKVCSKPKCGSEPDRSCGTCHALTCSNHESWCHPMEDEKEALEKQFNDYIAEGTPAEALVRAEEFLSFVEAAVDGLRSDVAEGKE